MKKFLEIAWDRFKRLLSFHFKNLELSYRLKMCSQLSYPILQ